MRLVVVASVFLLFGLGSYLALTWGRGAAPSGNSARGGTEGSVVRARTTSAGGATPIAVTSSVAPYAVTGDTERAIFESLLEGGPVDGDRRFFGMTESDMGLQYRTVEAEAGCFLVDVRATLDVVTTLPEWSRPSGTDYAVQRDWHRFRSALERHEAEHKSIAVHGVQKVYRAVGGLRRPTCAEAEAEARRRLDRIGIEIEASHRRYDDQTGHGQTEGAAWPPR